MLVLPRLIHLVEDVAPHSGVLVLLAEAVLVALDELWVDQTSGSSLCYSFEFLAIRNLSGAWFGLAFAVGGAVVNARGGTVCKTDFVFLGNFAVDFLNRKCVVNFCHS